MIWTVNYFKMQGCQKIHFNKLATKKKRKIEIVYGCVQRAGHKNKPPPQKKTIKKTIKFKKKKN